MGLDYNKIAANFLELSSEQRIEILYSIKEKPQSLSKLAETLGASKSEVHRNIARMIKAGLIQKDSSSDYNLTLYGKILSEQIPSMFFIPDNLAYFGNHTFGDIPVKFIQRSGSFSSCIHIKGFVKVVEQWKKIHQNSEKYIYNILSEVPYSDEIIDVIESKLKKNVSVHSVISSGAVVTDDRKNTFEKKNFSKYVKNELLQRRMSDAVSVSVLLNEKEACIIFPGGDGNPDMGHMFYGGNSEFHEWCLDYFEYCWKKSGSFQESKLK